MRTRCVQVLTRDCEEVRVNLTWTQLSHICCTGGCDGQEIIGERMTNRNKLVKELSYWCHTQSKLREKPCDFTGLKN